MAGDATPKLRSARDSGYMSRIAYGNGPNLIRIDGYIDQSEATEILRLMDINKTSGEKHLMGFELNCLGGDHDSIMKIYHAMSEYRKEGYSFYVRIELAYSAAMLIVAMSDRDKRQIRHDGSIQIHDGSLTSEFNDYTMDGRLDQHKWKAWQQYIKTYREYVLSESGLSQLRFTTAQLGKYYASNRLTLSVLECCEQFGFKLWHT